MPGDATTTSGDLWTERELRSAVQAYLDMFRAEQAGTPVIKSHAIAALRQSALQGRTRPAIEYCMHNIAALLDAPAVGGSPASSR